MLKVKVEKTTVPVPKKAERQFPWIGIREDGTITMFFENKKGELYYVHLRPSLEYLTSSDVKRYLYRAYPGNSRIEEYTEFNGVLSITHGEGTDTVETSISELPGIEESNDVERPVTPIIGQEAVCPVGLGRVVAFDRESIGIQVFSNTAWFNRSDVKLVDIGPTTPADKKWWI